MAASLTVRISFDSSFKRCFSASSALRGSSRRVASVYRGMILTAHYSSACPFLIMYCRHTFSLVKTF